MLTRNHGGPGPSHAIAQSGGLVMRDRRCGNSDKCLGHNSVPLHRPCFSAANRCLVDERSCEFRLRLFSYLSLSISLARASCFRALQAAGAGTEPLRNRPAFDTLSTARRRCAGGRAVPGLRSLERSCDAVLDCSLLAGCWRAVSGDPRRSGEMLECRPRRCSRRCCRL